MKLRRVHIRVEMDGARAQDVVDMIQTTAFPVSRIMHQMLRAYPYWQRIDIEEIKS